MSTDFSLLKMMSVWRFRVVVVRADPSISLHFVSLSVQHWSQNFFLLFELCLQAEVAKSWLHSRHTSVACVFASLVILLDGHSSLVWFTLLKVLLVSA